MLSYTEYVMPLKWVFKPDVQGSQKQYLKSKY